MNQRTIPERLPLTIEIADSIDPKKIILAGISSFGAMGSSSSVIIYVIEDNKIRSYIANARDGFESDKAYSLIGTILSEETKRHTFIRKYMGIGHNMFQNKNWNIEINKGDYVVVFNQTEYSLPLTCRPLPMYQDEKSNSREFSLDDPVVKKALEISISKRKWSTSLLQTYLSKGHAFMARLTNWAEKSRLIGPSIDNKPRDIYFSTIAEARSILTGRRKNHQTIQVSFEQRIKNKQLLPKNPCIDLETATKIGDDYYSIANNRKMTDEIAFVANCIMHLKAYFRLKNESEYRPPYTNNYNFSNYVFTQIKDNNTPLFLYSFSHMIAFMNYEYVDINPVYLRIFSSNVHKYRALYFIEKLGPKKALKIIEQIVYSKDEKSRGKLIKSLDFYTQGILTKRYRKLECGHATTSDITNKSAFCWQFRYLTLLKFDDAENKAIIDKISSFTEKQIAKHAEQISLFFFNYFYQIDRLSLKNIFKCAVHVYKKMPISGNSINNLRSLHLSAILIIGHSLKYESCMGDFSDDLTKFIYDTFWPKIGSTWPIKNRSRFKFQNEFDEEVFDLAAKMIGFDFGIEDHNKEFADYLKGNIVFRPPHEYFWFLSFLLRHSDLGFNSQDMLEKILSEIQCDELVPKNELMDMLCLLFGAEGSGKKLLDEVFTERSPLRQFGSQFFEKLFDHASEDTIDDLLIETIDKFDEVVKICGIHNVHRVFLQLCCSAYKLKDKSLLSNFAELISSQGIMPKTNIKKAMKASEKYIKTHELQNGLA